MLGGTRMDLENTKIDAGQNELMLGGCLGKTNRCLKTNWGNELMLGEELMLGGTRIDAWRNTN